MLVDVVVSDEFVGNVRAEAHVALHTRQFITIDLNDGMPASIVLMQTHGSCISLLSFLFYFLRAYMCVRVDAYLSIYNRPALQANMPMCTHTNRNWRHLANHSEQCRHCSHTNTYAARACIYIYVSAMRADYVRLYAHSLLMLISTAPLGTNIDLC